MPKRKQPSSLESLASKCVALAIQETCKYIDSSDEDQTVELRQNLSLFASDMPGPVLEQVLNDVLSCIIERLQRDKREKGLLAAINHLIQPNLKVVDLADVFFKVRLPQDMSRKCASLIPSRLIHTNHLTRLNLCSRCTDEALNIISKHCPMLNYLNISFSDLVTDAGILKLAGTSDGEIPGCRKLQYLGLMKLWDVTTKGIANLIEKMPDLSIAHYDCCGNMLEILFPKPMTLQLTNFDQSYNIFIPSYELTSYIGVTCPNIVSLCLYASDNTLPLFSILKKVEKADIELDGPAGSGLESWLASAGPNLKSLNLTFESMTWRQLEAICRHCPNLNKLQLLGSEIVWDEGAEMSVRFPPMQYLRISVWGDKGVSSSMLNWIFQGASHSLVTLLIDAFAPFLSDSDLLDVFARFPLLKLEELAISGGPRGKMTIAVARLAANLFPELRKISITGFSVPKVDFDLFMRDIRLNNYDLQVV